MQDLYNDSARVLYFYPGLHYRGFSNNFDVASNTVRDKPGYDQRYLLLSTQNQQIVYTTLQYLQSEPLKQHRYCFDLHQKVHEQLGGDPIYPEIPRGAVVLAAILYGYTPIEIKNNGITSYLIWTSIARPDSDLLVYDLSEI